MLCVPYKILERLIYARVEPLIDPLLPREQAGFRRGRSTVYQVTLLTQSIENAFEAKKKAGAVFIDLTAAYNTVWHRGPVAARDYFKQVGYMIRKAGQNKYSL